MIPNSFRRFAGMTLAFGDNDLSFNDTVLVIYNSIDPENRKEFLDYLDELLAPAVDPDYLKEIWDASKAGILLKNGKDVFTLLTMVRDICKSMQAQIDVSRRCPDTR